MNFADAGMIVGQFEFDLGMRKKSQTNANLLRNCDLPFAGNLHGITPTGKCNADSNTEQHLCAAGWSTSADRLIVSGGMSNDLRFCNAASTPDVQGHAFTDQRMELLKELRRLHGISFEV
jgi:hypothetical protein